MTGVYCITNILSNKKYISKSDDVWKAVDQDLEDLYDGNHKSKFLQASYKMNGVENFSFELLERCSIEELEDSEIYWIDFHKSDDTEFGYNSESCGTKLYNKTLMELHKNLKHKE